MKYIFLVLVFFVLYVLFKPAYTKKIKGENSISEYRKIKINGEDIQMLIRGYDRNNPVLVFVHGGPCCSEIPYIVKYQSEWEKLFTVVHYDQRGSGRSMDLKQDYNYVRSTHHVEDLHALTEYICKYLGKDKVLLAGHSYGTYIATQAVAQKPELYSAYIGIGQLSDSIESELDNLYLCIDAAKEAKNEKDVNALLSLEEGIKNGGITPRSYVRKYGFATRKINETTDLLQGLFFGREYTGINILNVFGCLKYQLPLWQELIEHPLPSLVKKIDIPFYFVMGKYDGMTSPKAARKYFDTIEASKGKEYVVFDNSAHYPQLDEIEKFTQWLKKTFK